MSRFMSCLLTDRPRAIDYCRLVDRNEPLYADGTIDPVPPDRALGHTVMLGPWLLYQPGLSRVQTPQA